MQRHVRSSSKMSKAKHRAEAKASLKKRVLGIPITPHPNSVPAEILQRHRRILEKLKIEAQELGQDVTDWDVENMIPQVGDETELFGTGPNAPGIPVGRRGGNKSKAEDVVVEPVVSSRTTRASNRPAVVTEREPAPVYEAESEHEASTAPDEMEMSQSSTKTPTQASVKPVPLRAGISSSPAAQQQASTKKRPAKKGAQQPLGVSPLEADASRPKSSQARTRGTKTSAQSVDPSGSESMEVEHRDTTESEDEEEMYQEETRRRHKDGEEEEMMEVD